MTADGISSDGEAGGSLRLEIFTVGHSTRSFDELLELLKRHAVTMLVDVRSRPYNPFIPQFNRDSIKMLLLAGGIVYAYLGDRLGRLPEGTPFKDSEAVDFVRVETSPGFVAGIEWLLEQAASARVCVFCGEAQPGLCHRDFLIAQNLMARGARVLHILADGRLEEAAADLFHAGPEP